MPQQWEKVGSITGLIINDIEKLKTDEERLLHESYPGLSLQDVLILEEGREPKSTPHAMGIILLGVVLMVGGGAVFVRTREG